MGYPKRYGGERETSIVTYDYIDIADGTGVVTYYGTQLQGASTSYALVTNAALGSDSAWTSVTNTSSTDILIAVFETSFNTPKVMQGTLIANIPASYDAVGAGPFRVGATVSVHHFDGTTETTIASQAGTTVSSGDALTEDEQYMAIPLPLTTTTFASGDKLRIRVHARRYGDGTCTGFIGHDPLGRIPAATLLYSILKFFIPFKITDL